jgi:sortase (surface protein transpeptidase)
VTGTEVLDVLDYKKRDSESEELTLYTCYPFGAEDKLRNERFFVYAEKISGPEIGE